MSKFTEPSHKILSEYLDILKTPKSGDDNSYLLGNRRTVVSKGGNDTLLYQKSENGEMVGHNFLIQDIVGNNFKFQYKGKISTYTNAADLVMGEEIYFRKDSYFHEWLRSNSDYENFVNTNKTFIYFGKIYPISNETTNYNIIFVGLKDFAINALPEHNQTDKIKELFKIFFDQVYHDIYNMTKHLWSFFDTKEVNIKHLDYLASRAGIETDKDKVLELPLREFIDNLPYWLKRKGTYTAYFIIYKLFLKNTINKLNIYERWVEWCLKTNRVDDDYILDYDFENHHVLEYYGVQPSGGAGPLYYDDYNPIDYPVRHIDSSSVACSATHITDRGDTNHTIICHNTVSLDPDIKKFGKHSMKFNGIDDYISIADHADWDIQTNFTIGLWVKHTDHTGEEDYISHYEDANNRWTLLHTHSHGIALYVISGGVQIIYVIPGGEITDTNWHYVLMAKVVSKYGIYLDGNQVSYLNDTSMATFSGSLYIGSKNGSSNYFKGQMDDVLIYHGNLFNASPNAGLTDTITVPTDTHIPDKNTKLSLPGSPYGVLSPHYKVEIDLSTEPLGENYIIDENTIDELVRYWEYIKPVSKFVDYHLLLSPTGKIDGNNESVSLYGDDYTAICDTRFTGTITTTGASATGDTYDKTESFVEKTSYSTWTINHDLASPELLIQTYDFNDAIIYPQSTELTERTVDLNWFGAVRGKTFLAGMKTGANASTAYYNTSGASAWDVGHTTSPSGIVYQVYSGINSAGPSAWNIGDVERLVPESAFRVNDSALKLTFDSTPSGAVFIRNSDYYHIQPSASDTWEVNHNLDIEGAIVQCWDNNNYRIYPEKIQKINSNQHKITFSEAISGSAAFIIFERNFKEDDVGSIGYWKIGNGATDDFNPVLANDVNNYTASGSILSFTETASGIAGYYIYKFNVPVDNEYTINELGLFSSAHEMLYYTVCSTLHKPVGVQLDVVYRIKKQVDST